MIDSSALGRLSAVEPRHVWPHEALDFTPWLLANVDVLSDLLGMDLVLEVAEHPVGDFSLDLMGYDEATGAAVIVENQLEQSDHTHLGQIITYAAGTDPQTIVWVTTRFRSEHRAAIDWLNERTDDQTRIFGVQINVVRIGDSTPAPNFELVAQPNDWEKQVRTVTRSGASAKQALYREFWEMALERMRQTHPDWTRARTSSQSWIDAPLGARDVAVSTTWTKSGLVVQIYFGSPNGEENTARFTKLLADRAAFEAALGEAPEWDQMKDRKACRVSLSSPFSDLEDRSSWDAAIDWLIDAQARLRGAVDTVGGPALFDVTTHEAVSVSGAPVVTPDSP